jgi:hypothetical protein
MPDCSLRRRLTLSRVVYVICTAFIVLYILFDVLDLDGSNFPTMRAPVHRTVVIVEVPKVGENVYLPNTTDLWVNVALLPTESEYAIHLAALHLWIPLLPDAARGRGYRIALPRSSPSDPFHSL